MSKLWRSTAVAAVASLALTSGLQAATLSVNQGPVLLNQGAGFKPVVGSVQVRAGDNVMVQANGSGEIVFDDQCRVRVDPGAVFTVGPESPCRAGHPPQEPASAARDHTWLIAGGVLAVGAGVAIIASRKSDPASP